MSNTGYPLPIPIGTPIYTVEPCCCGKMYATYHCRMFHGKKHKNATAIKAFRLPDKTKGAYDVCCVKLYIKPFDPVRHLSRLNKTAFLTEQEAIDHIENMK